MKFFSPLIFVSILTPCLLFAQTGSLEDVALVLLNIFDVLVGLVITAALIFFLYGAGKFIMSYDNEEERSEGKKFMMWGIIALFVMISVWALVSLVLETFNLTTDAVDLRPPSSGKSLGPINLSIFKNFSW